MSVAISSQTARDSSEVSLIASGATLALAATFACLRIGFGTNWTHLGSVVALSLFLLNFPALWAVVIHRTKTTRLHLVQSTGFPAGIAVSLLLARDPSGYGFGIVAVLAVVGVIWNLRTIGLQRPGVRIRPILFVGLLLTLWIAGVSWGNGFLNPLYLENLALHGGTDHIDTIFHASVSNMLRVHEVASTGLDGIPAFHYHVGSHWIFAQWASLTGTRVIDFYQLGYPVVVGPLFIAALVWLIQSIRRLRGVGAQVDPSPSRDLLMWVAIFLALTGFLPRGAMHGVGVWASGPLLSESYGVALTLMFGFIAMMLGYWQDIAGSHERKSLNSVPDALMLLMVFPLGFAALGFSKISVMGVLVPAAFYAVLRFRELQRPLIFFSMALCAAAFVWTASAATVRGQASGSLMLFSFMRYYLPSEWWPFFISLQFLWSWIYIAARLREKCIASFPDVRDAVRARTMVDVEILVIICVLGLLPGIVLAVGSDAFYFIDVQRWIALALLLGNVPLIARARSTLRTYRASGWLGFDTPKLIALFVGVPVLLNVGFTTTHFVGDMLRSNLGTRREVQGLAGHTGPVSILVGAKRAVKETLRGNPRSLGEFWRNEPATLFGEATMSAGMRKARGYSLISALSSLDAMSITQKRESVLFVPQSNGTFWSILPDRKLCSYTAFVGPAVSGMAMLDAHPPLGCKLSLGYGLAPYQTRKTSQTAEQISPATLCARARQLGFSKIYTLRMDSVRADQLDCATGA